MRRVARTTVHVRPYRDEDRAPVIAIWAEAFPDEPAHNVANDMIDRKLSVQRELFLVADADDSIVGTVMAGFDGVRGWIHRLAVSSSARRAGVGTALIRAAEAGLGRLGCPKVNLQVRGENSDVIAFYRAAGYGTEERISMGKRLT